MRLDEALHKDSTELIDALVQQVGEELGDLRPLSPVIQAGRELGRQSHSAIPFRQQHWPPSELTRLSSNRPTM